jgi:type I restriction enzyme S subunit
MKSDWKNKRLGDVLKLEYGKPLPDQDRLSTGMYPAYGANGEKARTNKYHYDKQSIIVGRKGSAGELLMTEDKFWPLDVTFYVTYNPEEYDLKFLYYLLKSQALSKLAKGVKPGINRNEVYAIEVSTPLLEEQRRIVSILDETFSGIALVKAITERKIAVLEELNESVLHRALAGDL